MPASAVFREGCFYHIYGKGIQDARIFIEERNYSYFLELSYKHLTSLVDIYAYCLMGNHFHMLIKVKPKPVDGPVGDASNTVSHGFNNLLNAYAKSYNNTYKRSGGLWRQPFGRQLILSESYLTRVIYYIHTNPVKHSFTNDFTSWPHSSYHALISDEPTILKREELLELFGNRSSIIEFHKQVISYGVMDHMFDNDSD